MTSITTNQFKRIHLCVCNRLKGSAVMVVSVRAYNERFRQMELTPTSQFAFFELAFWYSLRNNSNPNSFEFEAPMRQCAGSRQPLKREDAATI